MPRNKLHVILLIFSIILLNVVNPIQAIPFDYVTNDLTFHPTPNIPIPAKGVPFNDPVYHTEIVRITDSKTEAAGSGYFRAQPGYPKHNIENADGTKLIIQSVQWCCWHIWNAKPPYDKIRDIPIPFDYCCNSQGDSDARWDNTDPNILYFLVGPKFYEFNVSTGNLRVVHNFTNDFSGEIITNISMGEEGDASDDRRYWAFMTRSKGVDHQTHLIVYDKQIDRIESRLDWGAGAGFVLGSKQPVYNQGMWIRDRSSGNLIDFNFAGMSPSGEYVITGAPPSWIYKRDFSSSRIISTHGHVDPAFDYEGREVLVWAGGYWGPTGYTDLGSWLWMGDIRTGEVHPLAPIGPELYHVSGNAHDKPGWAVVSNYSPQYPNLPTKWSEHTVFMIELSRRIAKPDMSNHTTIWHLAQTHTAWKGYGDVPFAKLNKKGTKVWFGSGWGRPYYDKNPYDVYQINLPPTWYKDLTGNIPPKASISASPSSGKPPLTVNFTGIGEDVDGTIISYMWNFGDGSTSNQQNTSHIYEISGNYTVTFKVTDNKGANGNAYVTINVLKSDTTPPAPPKGLKIIK
jgi:hypothetical protein